MVSLTGDERDNGESPSDELLRKERDGLVRDAIRRLPERQRLTLILRSYHNMSHGEIAGILDTTEKNSRANYFHALKNLRAILLRKGEIDAL